MYNNYNLISWDLYMVWCIKTYLENVIIGIASTIHSGLFVKITSVHFLILRNIVQMTAICTFCYYTLKLAMMCDDFYMHISQTLRTKQFVQNEFLSYNDEASVLLKLSIAAQL